MTDRKPWSMNDDERPSQTAAESVVDDSFWASSSAALDSVEDDIKQAVESAINPTEGDPSGSNQACIHERRARMKKPTTIAEATARCGECMQSSGWNPAESRVDGLVICTDCNGTGYACGVAPTEFEQAMFSLVTTAKRLADSGDLFSEMAFDVIANIYKASERGMKEALLDAEQHALSAREDQ